MTPSTTAPESLTMPLMVQSNLDAQSPKRDDHQRQEPRKSTPITYIFRKNVQSVVLVQVLSTLCPSKSMAPFLRLLVEYFTTRKEYVACIFLPPIFKVSGMDTPPMAWENKCSSI